MPKESNELDLLIQRYLEGKCSEEEKKKLLHWMESLRLLGDTVTTEDVHQLRNRIDAITQPNDVKVRRINWSRYAAAAAAAIVLCIGSISYLKNQHNKPNANQFATQEVIFPLDVQRLRVYQNAGSEDRIIALSDGTQVTLTPNSSISYLEDFATDHRHVSLCGKARFDVAKDAARPFSVVTGDIHTTAIGTVFWVTRTPTQSIPTVQLLSGKVAITQKAGSGDRQLLAALQPGDVWDSSGIHLPKGKIEGESTTRAKENIEKIPTEVLVFHHTPLKDVFDQLATHFQTRFSYQESDLTGMTFYGNYTDQIGLEDILNHIMLTHEISIDYYADTAHYEVSIHSKYQTTDQN